MNIIKSTPPPSPLKRVIGEHCPNSSPKKQRLFEEELIQTKAIEILVPKEPKKPFSARSQQLKVVVERIKAKCSVVKPSLSSYIEANNIEGLKAAFNPLNYHIDNQAGIEELEEAMLVACDMPNGKALRLALVELLVQIEDLELLYRPEFTDFIESVKVPKEGRPHLVHCLITDEFSLTSRFTYTELRNFLTPIKKYTLLHYAAFFGKKRLYNDLVELGFDYTQTDGDGNIPLKLILKSIGASHCTASELVSFFRRFYFYDALKTHQERLGIFCLFFQDAIHYNACQMIPLVINTMTRWNGRPWKDWRNEVIPLFELDAHSMGRYALQDSIDENFDLTKRDSNGQNLLHWAVVMQNIPLIEALIHTELPSRKDLSGRNALHVAAAIPDIDLRILKMLTEVTPRAATFQDYFGYTALDYALEGDLYNNFAMLRQLGCEPSELFSSILWYSATNEIEAFRAAFDPKADYIKYPKLLHFATALGNHAIVDECLRHEDIDWHESDEQGFTALTLAIIREDAVLIDKIYQHQANSSAKWDKQEAINLIRFALSHPDHIDALLRQLPLDTLSEPNEAGWNPLALVNLYGGTALYHNLYQSLQRLSP